MSEQLAIYQLNAQPADKLDERRDATTRAHGGLCIVVATAAVAAWRLYPAIAAVLWLLLVVIALGWLANPQFVDGEANREKQALDPHGRRRTRPAAVPHGRAQAVEVPQEQAAPARALKCAPIAFLVLGAGAFLGMLALVFPSAAVSQ